jgi:protein phosphatase
MNSSANATVFRRQFDFDQKEFIGERELQEDYSSINFLKQQTELLFVLADGMGGHAGGEVASKTAVDAFVKTFVDSPSESIQAKLGAALQQANHEITNLINNNSSLDGMGCTLVGMHLGVHGINWISVGDSPLFLIRKNQLIRLNEDHSMAPLIEKSLREGKITLDEARNHPHQHVLRSAVTGGDLELIDAPANTFVLYAGDVVVLASDGILTLSDDEILNTIKGASQRQADSLTSALLSAVRAKRKPRQDNTTVQVFVVPQHWKGSSKGNLSFWLAIGAAIAVLAAGAAYVLTQNFGIKPLQEATSPKVEEEKIPQPVKPTEIPIPPVKENDSETPKQKKDEVVTTNKEKEKKETKENKESKNPKQSPIQTNNPPTGKNKQNPTVTNPEVEKNPGEVKKPGESGKDSNTPQINQLEKTQEQKPQEQKDKTPNSVSGSDVKANQKESLNGKPGALETTSSPPPKD